MAKLAMIVHLVVIVFLHWFQPCWRGVLGVVSEGQGGVSFVGDDSSNGIEGCKVGDISGNCSDGGADENAGGRRGRGREAMRPQLR